MKTRLPSSVRHLALAAEHITGGCGTNLYCPLNNATRGQMATFVVKTFGLQ